MFKEIVDKLGFTGVLDYLVKLVAYPLKTVLETAPAALLALYYARKHPWEGDPARAALIGDGEQEIVNREWGIKKTLLLPPQVAGRRR